jgi:hypothetical protein
VDGVALLTDGYQRIHGIVHRALDGIDPAVLAWRPEPGSNSVAWLVWHLSRLQDDHVADVAGREQVWTAGGWYDRFALPFEAASTGQRHTPDDVAVLGDADPELLLGYFDAVHEATLPYLAGLDDGAFDRIVDESWDPPVSLGVRLVSVLADNLQHAGQAVFVRGSAQRALGS